MHNENKPLRRNADVINLIAAILLTVLQTYQASQAREIHERLDEIEDRQEVIFNEVEK